MYITDLFSRDNPLGPKWATPQLSSAEFAELCEATVMLLARDPAVPDQAVVLGSGFIVGVADTLIVATASHIFSWWADKLNPPAPHAFRGLSGDREDLLQRLQDIVHKRDIAACVTPRHATNGMILPIVGLSINSNPRDLDAGFIQLALPPEIGPKGYTILPIDADWIAPDEPVLMAGYIGGGRGLADNAQGFDAGFYEQRVAVRAGRIGELVSQPEGHRSAMYRVNIPSLPGMSGGPLIALRRTARDGGLMLTAAGVISSSRVGTPFLLDHCEEGETWVSPIIATLGRKVSIGGQPITLSDAIHADKIEAFGRRARQIECIREEIDGMALTSFRERQPPK